MKRIALAPLILGLTFHSQYAQAFQKMSGLECAKLEKVEKKIVRFACFHDSRYEMAYSSKKNSIVLNFSGKELILASVPARFNPGLVGSDSLIGFLAPRLQVYKDSNILMYITAIRTRGGDGRGQCGSGSEIYLNFLDVSRANPKRYSSVLIGSCNESIEIDEQNVSDGELGEVFVDANRLRIKFLNYKNVEGYPIATVSHDFKKLEFE